MKYFFLLLILILPTIANAMCIKPTATQGAIADISTTIIALNHTGIIESNPLGLAGSTLLKIFALNSMENSTPEVREQINNTAGAVWSGAAINNIMALFGAAPVISITTAIISGLAIYYIPCENKND